MGKTVLGRMVEPTHPNPAKPGDLRWYVTNEKGEDEEVPAGAREGHGDDMVSPRAAPSSRRRERQPVPDLDRVQGDAAGAA